MKYHTPVPIYSTYIYTTIHRLSLKPSLLSSLMQKLKILPFQMPLNLFQLVLNLRYKKKVGKFHHFIVLFFAAAADVVVGFVLVRNGSVL